MIHRDGGPTHLHVEDQASPSPKHFSDGVATALADPALQALWNEISTRRARNMRLFADDLLATGSIRAALDRDAVADIIWSTNGPEYFALLVGERGWSQARVARWLAEAWALLLAE